MYCSSPSLSVGGSGEDEVAMLAEAVQTSWQQRLMVSYRTIFGNSVNPQGLVPASPGLQGCQQLCQDIGLLEPLHILHDKD